MEDFGLENVEETVKKIGSAMAHSQGDVQTESATPTEAAPAPVNAPQPSTEGQIQQPPQGEQFKIPSQESTYDDGFSVGNIAKSTALGMAETAAPLVGISDTVIDAINYAKGSLPFDTPDIPKVPEYESNATQAIRNISGLVIPSLGLRGMLLKRGAQVHAAKTAPKFLQNLGNRRSFQYFSKFGADVGTAGLVDYLAEQNQKDDNLLGTLKNYWPQTFQWIPESIATDEDDTPGEKRAKNVNEGAIFGLLGSVIEGAAYLTKAGRSMSRTAKFVPTKDSKTSVKKLKELTEDEFTNVKFSDNPVEDTALRAFARKEKELNDLAEYYISRGDAPPDWPLYDEGEKLVRTKDPDGIVGAAADAAQIQNNIQSGWGRLGNIITEVARKEGIQLDNLTNRTLVSQVTQELKDAGKFSKTLRSGKRLTERLIDEAGETLAATLLHPRVDKDDILGILDEFKRSVEGSPVRIVGKRGINQAVKQLKDQLLDLDAHKARAYLVTSEAGQVADFAEGARLMEDGASVLRTVDLMADRLEVLMVEKGLANFEANSMLSHINTWKAAVDTGDQRIMTAAADTILGNTQSRLTELIPKAKQWTNTIKEISRANPDFLKPFLLANEFTDGNVDSMFKLHQWAQDNLGVFKKAIYDRNPEVPSIVNKAMWGNIFNSWLSAIGTPMKAAAGNLTGLLGRGAATVVGAVAQGDLKAANQAMVAHFALDDTFSKAFDHMKLVFRKASNNPKEVSYVMRGDIALKTEKSLDTLRSYADAASKNGEEGANMLLGVFDDLEAIAMDPALRFGSNSMTALDGFAKSVVANTEAKYIAINKLVQAGEEITDKKIAKISEEIYNNFYDKNGMISDSTVDAITSEIALNADSPVVDGMNQFIKRFPAARAILPFPRTMANVIDTFGKWSPAGIFAADYHKLWGPLGRKKITDFSPEEIASFLKSKGRPVDEFAEQTFNMMRYEIKGKAAISSMFVTAAGFSVMNDRCTGTGHYNKAVQRQRIRSGWKAKTCKVPGTNKAVSYEWMGPLGDWLALTVDVFDNFDSLSSGMQEDLRNKLTFLLASSITNRSMLSQLEPLHDILQGNGSAASRFASSFLNNLVPLGGLRNELGKLMYPGLRQIRNEFGELLRNRNAWLDGADPSRALPKLIDPIDGKEIGKDNSWFNRVINMGPMKFHENPTKERQFLIDIEFNSSPTMRLSQRGALLKNHEITAINSKIGEQGYYKKKIQEVMKYAANLEYQGHKGYVNIVRAQRRGLISSEILDNTKFADVHRRLTQAYSQAKRYAEDSLDEPMRSAIREREYDLKSSNLDQRTGDLDRIYQNTGLQETLNMYK
tara:strand:- start:420 stop:4412 length:3993 start_codon:yes stop_codon:yes gene_type:complete